MYKPVQVQGFDLTVGSFSATITAGQSVAVSIGSQRVTVTATDALLGVGGEAVTQGNGGGQR